MRKKPKPTANHSQPKPHSSQPTALSSQLTALSSHPTAHTPQPKPPMNTHFQFKQFTIQQRDCAMKVCTDACLFGAWLAASDLRQNTILDIGSGTGLLMLMLAQKTSASIHGIEIEPHCFHQLVENVNGSRWSDRLTPFLGDVRNFKLPHQYDLIITNPPFFFNDLLPEAHNKILAKHSKQLDFAQLLSSINGNLTPHGEFAILLPRSREEEFADLATKSGFVIKRLLRVRHSFSHMPFRSMMYFTRESNDSMQPEEMTIYHSQNKYSDEFIGLLKDYYLYL